MSFSKHVTSGCLDWNYLKHHSKCYCSIFTLHLSQYLIYIWVFTGWATPFQRTGTFISAFPPVPLNQDLGKHSINDYQIYEMNKSQNCISVSLEQMTFRTERQCLQRPQCLSTATHSAAPAPPRVCTWASCTRNRCSNYSSLGQENGLIVSMPCFPHFLLLGNLWASGFFIAFFLSFIVLK